MIFVCDVMLGKLARYLRVLGLDAPYLYHGGSPVSPAGDRGPSVLFTKKAAYAGKQGAILVHSNDPREQLREISGHIRPYINPDDLMTRCIECNVRLVEARKEDIEPLVPEYIYHHQASFRTCPSCRRVYWEGSHAEEMDEWVRNFYREA